MKVEKLAEIIGSDFYTGVPDSQLKALCDYLYSTYGVDPKHHVIAANEGNATALAAGYYLGTGKVPVVYMQNSGEGNIINPLASLMNKKVYAIPCVFIIGWRGEPGIHDEPQHIYQGEITLKLLDVMGIKYFVIDKETSAADVMAAMKEFNEELSNGEDVAFVIRKGALENDEIVKYSNDYKLSREEAIECVVSVSGDDLIVSTTGKASRELFEIREKNKQGHGKDFLTVGSMGHASSIALGVAINQPGRRIWCIDGDGAMLMHMGAMGVIGSISPENMVHIVINNNAHETVGGQPTVSDTIDILKFAESCGYKAVYSADSKEKLLSCLEKAKNYKGLSLIEVKCALGARKDLGRPTTTALENRIAFMKSMSD